MKKLKIYFLLSQKFCHLLKNSSRCSFFINCSKLTRGTRTAYFFLSSRWHFLVEQMTFLKKVLSSRDSSRCISSSWPWLRHNEWVCCIRKNEKSKKILLAIRIIEPWRLNWDPFMSVAFFLFIACFTVLLLVGFTLELFFVQPPI